MDLKCDYVTSLKIDCKIYVYSQSKENQVLVDFGSCEGEILNANSIDF